MNNKYLEKIAEKMSAQDKKDAIKGSAITASGGLLGYAVGKGRALKASSAEMDKHRWAKAEADTIKSIRKTGGPRIVMDGRDTLETAKQRSAFHKGKAKSILKNYPKTGVGMGLAGGSLMATALHTLKERNRKKDK